MDKMLKNGSVLVKKGEGGVLTDNIINIFK